MESRTYAVEGYKITRTNASRDNRCEVTLTINWSTFKGGQISKPLQEFIQSLEMGLDEHACWSQYCLATAE
jgi:hypothetical protein